jgi:hypothetical protein
MSNNKLTKGALTAVATGVMAGTANAAESKAVNKLIGKIKDKSDEVRAKAWLSAGEVGAPAVKPLAAVMTDEDLEVARAAKRGLWKIVRYVGRRGKGDEKRAVVAECSGCFPRLVETDPSSQLLHCYRTKTCVRMPGWRCSVFPSGSPLRH